MKDLLLQNWFRQLVRWIYVLSWTVLIVFSLYYIDIEEQSLSDLISKGDILLETKIAKFLLPITIAMLLFWIDLLYIQFLEFNKPKTGKDLSMEFLWGLFLVGLVYIMMVKTYALVIYAAGGLFVMFALIKLIKTPLPLDESDFVLNVNKAS